MSTKILLVDDEPNVLQGYKRQLRKKYDLELAIGGEAAIEAAKTKGPFAVVVSDMQMPGMLGVEVLRKIHDMNEQTVRIMLTGNADQKTAVDAVNEGSIFRFLSKPCSPEELSESLDAALEHYRLITAEADLLSKTLSGSVKMLTQVLSIAMPEAFGMTQEARKLVRGLADKMGVGPGWQVEMAAMLMRVGCVSLPPDVLSKYLAAESLSSSEEALVRDTPKLGYKLVSAIPRLQGVAEIIVAQDSDPREDCPAASRILRVVGDYQRYFRRSESSSMAINQLRSPTTYNQDIVDLLPDVVNGNMEVHDVPIDKLAPGMVLEQNVEDKEGRLLISQGNEIHDTIIEKLNNLRRSGSGVREPIRVRVPANLLESIAEPIGAA
jgi:response regulator RpfG family c-di-GMP phosphodiesterase